MAAAARPQVLTPDRVVPIRVDARTPEANDPDRVALVEGRWRAQDEAYLGIAKMVEEHIRMLSGRQWDVWSDLMGRFVDPRQYMTEDEREQRQRPVMDYLGYWFMVTLSKVTENQPIIGFMPSNLDDHSAKLAEVCDPIFKTLFDQCEMPERYGALAAWVLAGGEAYLMTRPDFTEGEERELVGPAVLRLEREGLDPIERMVDAVPFDADGNPKAELLPLPDAMVGEDGTIAEEDYGYDLTGDGEPYRDKKGTVKVEVASVLEIRSQWGTNIPWNEKRWIIHRWFLPPDEVQSRWDVDVQPDTFPDMDESSPGYLERLLFGSGYFGAARGELGAQQTTQNQSATAGYVCGYTMWEKPCADYPEGRLLVVGGGKVIHDSIRPFATECAGPIRRVGFMPIPGRPVASTPLEKMVPLQKRYNRVEAQIAEHANLCTRPRLLVHASSGIDMDRLTGAPDETIEHDAPPGVRPAEYLIPGQLSPDVWRHLTDVRDHLFTIGSITGNEGESPTSGASGELIQQLRFNADRPLAPFTRSLELGAAGVAEDMLAILPVVWTEEEVIHYAGEDNTVQTVTVLPEMWEGSVNARPVMESAAPESRERRQQRLDQMLMLGVWGDPKSLDPMERQRAMSRYLELSRFPDMTRAARPGGVHRLMAERNLGLLIRETSAEQIPILPVYEIAVHLEVLEKFMASPDYMAQPQPVQNEMARYRAMLQDAEFAQLAEQTTRQADAAAVQAVMANQVAAVAGPPPGADAGGANGAPDGSAASPASSTSARPASSGQAA